MKPTYDELQAQLTKMRRDIVLAIRAGREATALAQHCHQLAEAAEADVTALRDAGAPLANIAYNLSQAGGRVLSNRDALCMKSAQLAWDNALNDVHKRRQARAASEHVAATQAQARTTELIAELHANASEVA